MSIASGIESLGGLVQRLRLDGRGVVADVVRQMRSVEQHANEASLAALAELCRASARTIEHLAGEPATFPSRAAVIADHLDRLCAFAARCAAASSKGKDVATIVPPAALAVPDADEAKFFAETVAMFVPHARSSLDALEQAVLGAASAAASAATTADIRRTVHTLKAEFGVLGMTGPQALCHQAEATLDACGEARRPFPVDAMLQCVDVWKQHVDGLARGERAQDADVEPLLVELRAVAGAPDGGSDETVRLQVGGEFAASLPEFLSEARAHVADAEAAMVALSAKPDDLESIAVARRALHTIIGVAGFLNLTPLVELARGGEVLLDAAREKRAATAGEIQLVLAVGDMIGRLLGSLEGQHGPVQREWQSLVSRLSAAASGDDVLSDPAPAAAPPAAVTIPSPPAARSGRRAGVRLERTVEVSTSRLDALVDMAGELVVAQSMALQDPAHLQQLGKVARGLQAAAMSLRLASLQGTFQQLARLARDVAGKTGKQVALATSGADVELDRDVVEQIAEPLVHLIRNAVDHGIETPAARRAAGKDPTGQLSLSAVRQGDTITIEVRDDGAGLDRARIAAKAVEKGLLATGGSSLPLSDDTVLDLISTPGFSTADEVTDLSGRGIGMDVVRQRVDALRGSLEVSSRDAAGTSFRLRLPVTLAVVDGMVVRVGASRYVVPMQSIQRVFRVAAADVHHLPDRAECVRVRGAVLPVHRLKHLFAQADGLDDLTAGLLLAVEADGLRSCVFVDEVIGRQQVTSRSFGNARERAAGTYGGAIMSDGRVALILDVGTFRDVAPSGAGAGG